MTIDWHAASLGTAEVLCAKFQRHKPVQRDGVYACDRCREQASEWADWVRKGHERSERWGLT